MTTDDSIRGLLDADGRCLDSAEVFLDALADHPSPVGYRRLVDEIRAASELAERFRPESTFESLLVRHLRASWHLMEEVARYRFNWPEVPVADLLEALAGAGAMTRLEEYVAGLDPDGTWEYLHCRHRYRGGRVTSGDAEIRSLVEKVARRLTRGFRDWLRARDWDLPGLDAEVVVGPESAENSWYHPARHRVVLGGAEFMVFEREGRPAVNPVSAVHSLAHELLGHAVQDALSRDLPAPLRPDDRSRLRFATLPVAEGFAAHAASLAADFAEENGDAFGLRAEDLEFLRRMIELTPLHYAVPALISALAARARQEPGFDALAYITRLCGHGGFGEMLSVASLQPAYKLLYGCSCFFGMDEVGRAAAQLEARGVTGGAALRDLGRGAWALPCYREAVLAK